MKDREGIYPDLKVAVLVQGQNQYNIWIPIHQRREQTLNKQAKTDGEIKCFAANTNAVTNRSYEAETPSCLHKTPLYQLFTSKLDLLISQDLEIWSSKFSVLSKITTLTGSIHFWGKKNLYNLSSGAAMAVEVTDYLVLLHEKGKNFSKDFLQSRILTTTKIFEDKITRNNNKKKLVAPACSNKEPKNIDMNRNVLGQLILHWLKSDCKINFEEAL